MVHGLDLVFIDVDWSLSLYFAAGFYAGALLCVCASGAAAAEGAGAWVL